MYFEGIVFGGDWGIDMNWAVLFCRGCGGSYIHLNTCLGGGGIIYKSS